METRKPRILLFDIETAPSKGWFWQMYETNIIEVEQHGYMLSFSAKWLGEKRVYTHSLNDFSGHKAWSPNDKKLVAKLAEYIESSDIIVAHNGDRFDIVTTNTRLIANGLKPLSPKKTVDTLKVARTKFKFLSNRLDDLGNFLGLGRKLPHTGKDLWFKCMQNDTKAWDKMRRYNEQDVKLLEAVYLKLRPWMTNHPNSNVIMGTSHACPNCGEHKLQRRGQSIVSRTGAKRQRYQCMGCGSWSQGELISQEKVIVR